MMRRRIFSLNRSFLATHYTAGTFFFYTFEKTQNRLLVPKQGHVSFTVQPWQKKAISLFSFFNHCLMTCAQQWPWWFDVEKKKGGGVAHRSSETLVWLCGIVWNMLRNIFFLASFFWGCMTDWWSGHLSCLGGGWASVLCTEPLIEHGSESKCKNRVQTSVKLKIRLLKKERCVSTGRRPLSWV